MKQFSVAVNKIEDGILHHSQIIYAFEGQN